MKTSKATLLSATLVAIVAMWYTFVHVKAQTQGKAQGKAASKMVSSAQLMIRKAVYGYLPEGPTIDVTDKVRSMVKNGGLSVTATESTFGDPSNGTRKLTITNAVFKFKDLGAAADVTDQVKRFQDRNSLHMIGAKGDPGIFTVYYDYGDGTPRSSVSGDDGSLNITPPTKLRTDYTFNGKDNCKIVNDGHKLEINTKSANAPNDLTPFLGDWGDGVTIELRDGRPKVNMPADVKISDEKFECGSLSYKRVLPDYEFVDTLTPTSGGLDVEIFRKGDGRTFYNKWTRPVTPPK